MRTNIVLDDALIEEAFKYASVKTKRELVQLALQEFVDQHRRLDIRQLRGSVQLDDHYDHKQLRNKGALE